LLTHYGEGLLAGVVLEGIQETLLAAERLESKRLLTKWFLALVAALLSESLVKIISTVRVLIQVFPPPSDVTTDG
jgi:rhamnogalacturonyl hydrolase YesR